MIDSEGCLYLTVNSLVEINNIIISLNNFTLRKVNLKSYRFDKMYMDKDLKGDTFYQILDQFNERIITYKIYKNTCDIFNYFITTSKIFFVCQWWNNELYGWGKKFQDAEK